MRTGSEPTDSGLAGSLAAFMRIEKIISDNLYHQQEKVEDARLIAREQIGHLSALTPATTDHDALVKGLERAAVTASETQRSMAEAKSLRQEGNAERRTDLYMWPTPEQTLEGKAAAAIRHLSAARREGMEEAARIVLSHSNYGHIEGNRRALAIHSDLERRAKAIRDAAERQP